MGKRFWIILLAAACTGLTGCLSNDPVADDPSDPSNGNEVPGQGGYIAFKLDDVAADTYAVSATSTRGDIHREYDDTNAHYEWFNRGSKQERAITDESSANRVLFFTEDNAFYGAAKLSKTVTENVYLGRQPASTSEVMPTKFLAVVNGDPDRLDALSAGLAAAGTEALKQALNWLQELDEEHPESHAMYGDYFTMSSSIYMAADDRWVEGVTTKRNFRFFETPEEALLQQNLLSFHVDRVLAKVTVRVQNGELSFEKGDVMILRGPSSMKVRQYYYVEDGTTEKDVVTGWRASIANWGINGIEKNTFLFKTLVEKPAAYPWEIPADFYKFWSEYRLYRSYWAVDENYTDGFYPDQFRVVIDEDGVTSGSTNTVYSDDYDADGGLTLADYTLVYRSYNAFANRSDHKYSVENTFDSSIVDDQQYKTQPWLRCGSHVIVAAQLLLDALDKDVDTSKVDENGFIAGVSDKYASNGLYWSKEALIQQSVATLISNIAYNDALTPIRNVLGSGNVAFINNDEENPLDEQTPVVDDAGVVISASNATDYFDLAPAFIKGGDGWVTIRLKEGKKLMARHQDGTDAAISEEQLVAYIYKFSNRAQHFKEGRMYYALPIRHNVASPNFENGYERVSTGDYGLVRNTWYRLTITEVLAPGIPVDDPDQPIIPNPEPDDKSLGVNVEIIPWHIVDIQVPNLQ